MGKSCRIRVKVVVVGLDDCIRQTRFIRAKVVVFRQSGCIWEKVVVFRKGLLYSGKVVVIGINWLYSGTSGCIRTK